MLTVEFSELFMELMLQQFWMSYILLQLPGNIFGYINYHNKGSHTSQNRILTRQPEVVSQGPHGHMRYCTMG